MSKSPKHLKTYIHLPLVVFLLLTNVLTAFVLIKQNKQMVDAPKNVSSQPDLLSNEAPSNTLDPSIKLEYFDDFQGSWGTGTNWKGGYSSYSERSKPVPVEDDFHIIYPDEAIEFIRDDMLRDNIFLDDHKVDYDSYKQYIDHDRRNYDEKLVNYFWTKALRIDSIAYADVDMDGQQEMLIETMVAGSNHPPHIGYIVKNDQILAEVSIFAGGLNPTKDGNGFYVEQSLYENDAAMCCPSGKRVIRVVYKEGAFVPAWQQDVQALIVN